MSALLAMPSARSWSPPEGADGDADVLHVLLALLGRHDDIAAQYGAATFGRFLRVR